MQIAKFQPVEGGSSAYLSQKPSLSCQDLALNQSTTLLNTHKDCFWSHKSDLRTVGWHLCIICLRLFLQQSVGTFYINGQIDIAPVYEGRAFLEVDMDRQLSTLRLTKVTMQDSRRYECSVKIQGDDEGTPSASTSLLVLGENSSLTSLFMSTVNNCICIRHPFFMPSNDFHRLSRLFKSEILCFLPVPPSKPICEIQGSAEYWQDITLTCRSEEGSPQPAYQWTTFSVENRPRDFPPKANQSMHFNPVWLCCPSCAKHPNVSALFRLFSVITLQRMEFCLSSTSQEKHLGSSFAHQKIESGLPTATLP